MPLAPVNKTTAQLTLNLLNEGRYVLVNPIGYPVKGWIDLGEFPTDQKVSPNNNVNRTEITAANREGGPDVILARSVSSVAISYDISSLTPDDTVRALHAGAMAVPLVDAALVGVTGYAIDPSVSLTSRMIIVRKRPIITGRTRVHRVVFHPRVDLSPNGVGDSNGKETLIFQASVTPFIWTLSAGLTPLAVQLSQYGVQFDVPDAQLDAVLTLLDTEAKPVGDDV